MDVRSDLLRGLLLLLVCIISRFYLFLATGWFFWRFRAFLLLPLAAFGLLVLSLYYLRVHMNKLDP